MLVVMGFLLCKKKTKIKLPSATKLLQSPIFTQVHPLKTSITLPAAS